MGNNENTYTLDLACGNCHFDGSVSILKGVLIVEEKCPNCGCKTLRKTFKGSVGASLSQAFSPRQ